MPLDFQVAQERGPASPRALSLNALSLGLGVQGMAAGNEEACDDGTIPARKDWGESPISVFELKTRGQGNYGRIKNNHWVGE
jgi:hypothetical protein